MVDRLKRALEDLRRRFDDLAVAIDDALAPAPVPVPVPVRTPGGRQRGTDATR